MIYVRVPNGSNCVGSKQKIKSAVNFQFTSFIITTLIFLQCKRISWPVIYLWCIQEFTLKPQICFHQNVHLIEHRKSSTVNAKVCPYFLSFSMISCHDIFNKQFFLVYQIWDVKSDKVVKYICSCSIRYCIDLRFFKIRDHLIGKWIFSHSSFPLSSFKWSSFWPVHRYAN